MPRTRRTSIERRQFERERKAKQRQRSREQAIAQANEPARIRPVIIPYIIPEARPNPLTVASGQAAVPESNEPGPDPSLRRIEPESAPVSSLHSLDFPASPGFASSLLGHSSPHSQSLGSVEVSDIYSLPASEPLDSINSTGSHSPGVQPYNSAVQSPDQIHSPSRNASESPFALDLYNAESLSIREHSSPYSAPSPPLEAASPLETIKLADTDSEYSSDSSSRTLEGGSESDSDTNNAILLNAQLQAESSPEDDIDLAAELAQHLLRFESCSAASHQAANRQHTEADLAVNSHQHVSLTRYHYQLIDAHIPTVINQSFFFTPAYRQAYKPQPNWRYIFEGQHINHNQDIAANQHRNNDEPEANIQQNSDHLCLTCSEITARPMTARFDIDSFLGFAQSLAFARQGVDINLFPRFHSNIQNDLHLYTRVYHNYGRGERPVHVKLKKVPHYCAGRVLGHEDIAVYIFFPRMYNPEKPTNFPGKSDGETHGILRTWTDSILIPAIFRHVPATSRQHFPHSWEHARQKSQAYYQEHSTRPVNDKAVNQGLSLHYSLHPHSLAAIWQDVEQQLAQPRNALYYGAKLFFSSKNTKLRFTYPTLSEMWEAFERPLTAAIDLRYINLDEVWLDLGKEVTAEDYTLASERIDNESQPVTGLLKTCCLESFSRWASFNEPSRSVTTTIYPNAMLRDASNLTLEMSRLSRHRREGWIFSQAYNSYKELFDAAQTKPFSNPYLRQLTWDSQITKMLQRQGRAYLTPDSKLRASYQASKQRLYQSIQEGINLSYGIREEHRLSLSFFDRVRTSLQRTSDWEAPLEVIAANSTYIRSLSTREYLRYLASNANKYMAAFEWILASDQSGRPSYEHCKLMTMLLQALPFTFDSGLIRRQSELWKDQFQRRRGGVPVLGMGFQITLATFGYMWLLPRIDWGSLSFQPSITDQIAYSSSMLRDNYRRNSLRVKDTKDDYARLEAAGQWLTIYRDSENCTLMIFQFMIWVIIRSFRKEVWSHFKPQIYSTLYPEAALGQLPLCYQSIRRLFTDEAYNNIKVVTSTRIKTRTVKSLLSRLWGLQDQHLVERGSWEHISFRVLCLRAVELIKEHYTIAIAKAFHHTLQRYFIATNWLFPYPRDTQFFQKNQQKQSMWIAVYHRRIVRSAAKRTATLPLEFLLSTTLKQPTRYRYDRLQPPKSQEAEDEYMPDWKIAYGNAGFYMAGFLDEQLADYLQAKASLTTISEELERVWQRDQSIVED